MSSSLLFLQPCTTRFLKVILSTHMVRFNNIRYCVPQPGWRLTRFIWCWLRFLSWCHICSAAEERVTPYGRCEFDFWCFDCEYVLFFVLLSAITVPLIWQISNLPAGTLSMQHSGLGAFFSTGFAEFESHVCLDLTDTHVIGQLAQFYFCFSLFLYPLQEFLF